MLVYAFGKVDSPCCLNWALLQVTLKTDISLKNLINLDYYMDKFLKSLSMEEVNLSMYIINYTGISVFRLTQWISNLHNVLGSLPPSELSPKIVNFDLLSQPTERAFGMSWDIEHDTVSSNLSKSICL